MSRVNMGAPLADRMRPQQLDQFVGQAQILGPGKPLRQAIESDQLHSMLFWGPPGTGKTTLARMLAQHSGAHFASLSAVLSGVADIRKAIKEAELRQPQRTLLFVDEVHRFNKSQQDAFLPHVENGTIILIGATTENPSFELNNALLSRCRVYVLKRLKTDDLVRIQDLALDDRERGLATFAVGVPALQRERIAQAADGDARCALTLLEIAVDLARGEGHTEVAKAIVDELIKGGVRRFDNKGDIFYDQISALHKAVRGSSPDGALYWLARMLDGGCDPLYIARRVTRMASEDIGNADPRGLQISIDAWDVMTRLGSPEGELALAQAVSYLACAPKSNAVYKAFGQAMKDARGSGSLPVPAHLCNAPTQLMKDIGNGKNYRYAHDEPGAYAAGEKYFPLEMGDRHYYEPVNDGLEIRIAERLQRLREQDRLCKNR